MTQPNPIETQVFDPFPTQPNPRVNPTHGQLWDPQLQFQTLPENVSFLFFNIYFICYYFFSIYVQMHYDLQIHILLTT